MKKPQLFIHSILVTLLFFSCSSNSPKSSSENLSDKTINTDTSNTNPLDSKFFDLELDLISLEIVDSNNTDVFTKYGIITSGMCYDCNLANISISKGKIQFANICDSTNRVSYDITTIEKKGSTVEINTKENIFTLEAINEGKVYRLSSKGNSGLNKNLKLVEYYTGKKYISKFKLHDCGDFEG